MYKMTPMEKAAVNEGLSRMQLTRERVEVALSVMLTKEVGRKLCRSDQQDSLAATFSNKKKLSFFFSFSFFHKKKMQADLVLKVPALPEDKAEGAECGGESCKLGCICSSIHGPVKVPLHCRRPECMFGCTCFKRKIMKQPSPGEPEPQVQPVYCKIGLHHSRFSIGVSCSLPVCSLISIPPIP